MDLESPAKEIKSSSSIGLYWTGPPRDRNANEPAAGQTSLHETGHPYYVTKSSKPLEKTYGRDIGYLINGAVVVKYCYI